MDEKQYHALSVDDRLDALEVAERSGGLKAHRLEKDVWVVATFRILFDVTFAEHLTFKGGTSLSRMWRAIRRFSEDIEIAHDIRAFALDLVGPAGDEVLAATRSQDKRWTRAIRARLAEWIRDRVCPIVEEELARGGFAARVRAETERLHIGYEPPFEETGFVRPEVVVEVGARSTGEPRRALPVRCDAAAYLPGLAFPHAHPTAMFAERTFWKKATAIHAFCCQERRRGKRLSRHRHNLARLDEAGIPQTAPADRALAFSVARQKAMFFFENDASGKRINYEAAVSGGLQLEPAGNAHRVLASDHARMLADGMLPDEHKSFDELTERCAAIEARANYQ